MIWKKSLLPPIKYVFYERSLCQTLPIKILNICEKLNHDKRRSEITIHRNTEVLLVKGVKLEVQHLKDLAEKVEV